MNRKLIRTTLAEVKGKAREVPQPRERSNGGLRRTAGWRREAEGTAGNAARATPAPRCASERRRRWKLMPSSSTTRNRSTLIRPWLSSLLDGEEIEGTIEWYDRGALKVNRKSEPNLLLLKRNVKYMYKADERVEQASDE